MSEVYDKNGKKYFIKNNLKGKRFSRLVVLSFYEKRGYLNVWKIQCDCGKINIAYQSNILTGKTKTCGCGVGEAASTHRMSNSKVYHIWEQIIQRCTNKNHVAFKYYGGRGIKICEEWLVFENFYKDMGEPKEKEQIDRIDCELGYFKNNCRWTTISINSHNVRSHKNSLSKYKGVTKGANKNKWLSQICKDGKRFYLGTFETEELAAEAYNKKAIELYGDYASLNKLTQTIF